MAAIPFIGWLWRALRAHCESTVLLMTRLLQGLRERTVARFVRTRSIRVETDATDMQQAPPPHVCPTSLIYCRRPGPWRRNLSPPLPEHVYEIPAVVPYGEIYFQSKGHYLGAGATSFVDRLVSGHVVKYPQPNPYCPEKEQQCREQMKTEAEAYRRIGESKRIPRLIDWDADACSLVLEFLANGDLQSYLERHGQTITTEQRRAWARHAVEALAVVHSAEIIHCDVTPRNFLLDDALELHLSDFAGCSVAGSRPSIGTSPRFQRPGWSMKAPPTYADDLFALGSLLYYIQTGHEPYDEVPEEEVQDRFKAAVFPEVSTLDCGSIIHKCWTEDWSDVHEILDALAQ